MRTFSMPLSICAAVIWLWGPVSLQSEAPTLLWPTGARTTTGPSAPHNFLLLGDKIVFKTGTRESREEAWISDGTDLGTWMLPGARDFNAGGEVRFLARIENRLIWRRSVRMFSTDGTRRGTIELTAPLLKADSLLPFQEGTSRVVQDRLFFQAVDVEAGTTSLWLTDGTLEGTRLLHTFDTTGERRLFSLSEVQGQLSFFVGTNEDWTLWLSDGTPDGTLPRLVGNGTTLQQLAEQGAEPDVAVLGDRLVVLGRRDGTQVLLAVDVAQGDLIDLLSDDGFALLSFSGWAQDGRALFSARLEEPSRTSIWETDGTPEGTREFGELPQGVGTASSEAQNSARRGDWLVFLQDDVLFFSSEDEFGNLNLWTLDRRSGEARPLTYPCGDEVCRLPGPITEFFLQGDRLVFTTLFRPPLSQDRIVSVWSVGVDGEGPEKIRDLCTSRCGFENAPELRRLGDELLFVARSEENERFDLWSTTGTRSGTRQVIQKPLDFGGDSIGSAPPFWNGPPQVIRHADGRLFFAAADEIHGQELWVQERDKVSLVSDLERGVAFASSRWSANWQGDGPLFWALGNRVYRLQGDPRNHALEEIFEHPDFFQSGRLFLCGEHLIWLTQSSTLNSKLLRISTATGDAETLLDRRMLTFPSTAVGDFIYFPRYGDFFFMDIWKTDGTPGNSKKAFSLPLAFPAGVFDLVPLSEKLLVVGIGLDADEDRQEVLWISDGTQEGTEELFSTSPEEVSDSLDFFTRPVEWQGKVYFVRFRNGGGGLWSADLKTKKAELRFPMGEDGYPGPGLHEGKDRLYLYFSSGGSDPANRNATLVTTMDGTTWQVLREFPGSFDSSLTAVGSTVFFVADDGIHGRELWKTDGTPEGTSLVRDIVPGGFGGNPVRMRAAGDWLYFDAATVYQGRELWVTDGTAEGTRLAVDLSPGPRSSFAYPRFAWRDVFFFNGDDGLVDDALWSIPTPDAAHPGCRPSETSLCLNNDRFQVEIDWLDFQGNRGRGNAVQLTPDTGYFWFFSPNNVEVVTKVLDARVINDHQWVFFGALSNVEYMLKVTDTETGARRFYFNPLENFASIGDTSAFGPNGAQVKSLGAAPETIPVPVNDGIPAAVTESFNPAAIGQACAPSSTQLCLTGDRFTVEARWTDFQGNSGVGQAVGLTEDTGYFWFFTDNNVEVVLKVLDARVINDRFWVFYGALSNVEYDLVVTDTETGAVRTYSNPSGTFASVGDTAAF